MSIDKWAHLPPNFTCPICGTLKHFPSCQLEWRKTCSTECYRKRANILKRSNREKFGFTCEVCGTWKRMKPFEIATRNPRFCSRKCFAEYRRVNKTMVGAKNHQYKGRGWRELARYIRDSAPYENWVKEVKERSGGICEECGGDGCEAHHVFPVSDILDFLLDTQYGKFLCKDCHNVNHNKTSRTIKQVLCP